MTSATGRELTGLIQQPPFPMPHKPTFRLVAISPDGTRVVLGTHLTEAQAKAIIELLAQGVVATKIVVEPEGNSRLHGTI